LRREQTLNCQIDPLSSCCSPAAARKIKEGEGQRKIEDIGRWRTKRARKLEYRVQSKVKVIEE
jgi:hypothetical protein